jgi:dicarboxylate transporter 10
MEAAKHSPAAAAAASRPAIQQDSKKKKKQAIRYPFWFGGSASSMAACVTHPLDLRT